MLHITKIKTKWIVTKNIMIRFFSGKLENEDQIKIILKNKYERANDVRKALFDLFHYSNTFKEARPDLFELVLPAMSVHSSNFIIQLLATACLFNLTRGDFSKQIDASALSQGVLLTLNAMSAFPDKVDLQKNSFLILYNNGILQEVDFERFRCTQLVFNTLCAFDDVNMNIMGVVICTKLAPNISLEEISKLGTTLIYIQKLLAMVQSRVDTKVPDVILKFTLSALRSLTDESAATCKVILEQGGVQLLLNVLKNFRDDSVIKNVLGLLNNIAEVRWLKQRLMHGTFINDLFSFLKSDNFFISYSAAGIVTHLASDGSCLWTASHTHDEMLIELESAVSRWKIPDGEIDTYRSFRSFFPLLKVDMDYRIQLWAVWAIHMMCSKNPKRYCLMLHEENGHLLLTDLINFVDSHPDIKTISTRVLEMLECNGKI